MTNFALEMKKRGKSKGEKYNQKVRNKRLVCCVNDHEQFIIDKYLKQFKVNNRARWMRETLLESIYRSMNENYPTLFDEYEMRM